MTEAAKRKGFAVTEPSNFDLRTGWNFFDAQDRVFFLEGLARTKARLRTHDTGVQAFFKHDGEQLESNGSTRG